MALVPDKINIWATLAANVGVLLGLFVVAFEIRQNSNLARASTRLEIAHDSFLPALTISGNEGLATALYKANSGEDVSPIERIRLQTLLYATNVIYENAYFQYRTGMLLKEQWQVFLAGLRRTRQEEASRQFLIPELYSEAYRQLVEQIDSELDQ
jgi:hypothetical protein